MKPDSVRSLKAELSAEIIAESGDSPEIRSFFGATEPPMPCGLGIALGADGEHVLAIRTTSRDLAGALAVRAKGEADVRIMEIIGPRPPPIESQATANEMQGTVRPLEPGAQVNIRGANFVGTLGAFVRDGQGVAYALSNSHVLADVGNTPIGTGIGQPFGTSPIGVLARHVPLSRVAPNLVDAAIARLDATSFLGDGWNAALGGRLQGTRALGPADLGRRVSKVGRTTGIRHGAVTAVELDGVVVNYGDAGLLTFNRQAEISGGPDTDFSAGGDSGSTIVDSDGFLVGLLFAGGVSGGIDHTFANDIRLVLAALGVELVL